MKYVEFNKVQGRLRITLTKEGRNFISEIDDLGDANILNDLFEFQLANGWSWIQPEEIGALTNGPIITDEVSRDDDNNIIELGTVYWHERYQVENPIQELYTEGYVDFLTVQPEPSDPADIIWSQISNSTKMACGARNRSQGKTPKGSPYLQFNVTLRPGKHYSIKVVLEPSDTYTVYLMSERAGKIKEEEKADDIYCDNLSEVIYRMCNK